VTEDPDAVAAERVLAGEAEAFSAIVRHWQGPLFRLAFRYVPDRPTAEDLTQEVFLRAFTKLREWRGEARFSTWLVAIAINVFRSEARKRPAPSLAIDEQSLASAVAADGDDAARDRVRRAIAALPEIYRDALNVHYFLEQDVAAAAHTLRIPEGTLKARLHRARKLLEDLLAACGRAEES